MTTAAVVNATQPANLIQKLAAVMAQIERVPKNGRNQFHNYDYATEADISDAVRSAMARYGVMLIPSVKKVEWREVETKGGVKERLVTLTVEFTATDGQTEFRFEILGEGQDRSDKATYKAMTGANKYALLKLFQIPTGDDPETDSEGKGHTEVRGQPSQRAPAQVNPPYVMALWSRAQKELGDAAGKAWSAAATATLGTPFPPAPTWTEEQATKVGRHLFGAP